MICFFPRDFAKFVLQSHKKLTTINMFIALKGHNYYLLWNIYLFIGSFIEYFFFFSTWYNNFFTNTNLLETRND